MLRRSLKKKGKSTTKKKRHAKKNPSKPKKGAKKYPYVVHDKAIWLPNKVWAAYITYVRLEHGYVYLVMIIDLYSRKILSWSISNTMDAQFCISALEEAIARFGIPAIFNTEPHWRKAKAFFASFITALFEMVRRAFRSITRQLLAA